MQEDRIQYLQQLRVPRASLETRETELGEVQNKPQLDFSSRTIGKHGIDIVFIKLFFDVLRFLPFQSP